MEVAAGAAVARRFARVPVAVKVYPQGAGQKLVWFVVPRFAGALFFLNAPAPPEFSPLPLHAPLPIFRERRLRLGPPGARLHGSGGAPPPARRDRLPDGAGAALPRRGPRPPQAAVRCGARRERPLGRSEEHTSELQSQSNLVCRLLLEK